MDKVSLILSVVLMLGLAIVIAPNILALNRGKILRNIALWLAIFAALGLVYRVMHGGGQPINLQMFAPNAAPQEAPSPGGDKNNGAKGFNPPGE